MKNNFETNNSQTIGIRRRDLLPVWIKVFTWLFLIMSLVIPVALAFGILKLPFNLELYGLVSTDPFSLIGLVILGLIAFKGVIAYGLLGSKPWAVRFAKADAMFGIGFCAAMMIVSLIKYSQGVMGFSFRLELLILIPYLLVMMKIEEDWSQGY